MKVTYFISAIRHVQQSTIDELHSAKVSKVETSNNSIKFEGWRESEIKILPHASKDLPNLYAAALKYNVPQWYHIQIKEVLQNISINEIEHFIQHDAIRVVADGSYQDNTAASATVHGYAPYNSTFTSTSKHRSNKNE